MTRRAGVDVGGTKFLGVVLNDHGDVVAEERIPTTRAGGDAMIEGLVELGEKLRPWDSLGIGIAGIVTRGGVVRGSPNLVDIHDLAVGPRVSEALAAHVYVDNDATCAAVAEWRIGAAQGAHDIIVVTLGTGIGGGLISNGRLQRGTNGFAGEIGHMVVDPSGPPCPCGRRGCWERYASGNGLAYLARLVIDEGRLASVLELAGGDTTDVRGEHVVEAARAGDPDALEVIDTFGHWVGLGLGNLVNICDPEVIVLGGGLAAAPELFLPPIEKWFAQLLYYGDIRPHPQLVFATLRERAGAIGAAMLVNEHQV